MAKRPASKKTKSGDDKKAQAPVDYQREMEKRLRDREKTTNRKMKMKMKK